MKVAVVGNRNGFTYEQVKSVLERLGIGKNDTIISGGAIGVDTFAQKYAEEVGAEMIICYPDSSKPIPTRYFERNKEIVDIAEKVVAFNKKPHGGTTMTINYAKKQGKKLFTEFEDILGKENGKN